MRFPKLWTTVSMTGMTVAALLLIVSDASAQTVESLSGKFEQYCCNWPGGGRPGFIPPTPTLNKINAFPFAGDGQGVTIRLGLPDTAMVTVDTGGTLAFPANAINAYGTFLNQAPVFPGWISIYTAVNFRNQQGTLAPGGQTGSAAYCMNYAGNPNCTDPNDGGASFNGLLSYAAGPNQFGGTMRILGGTPGFLRRTTGGPARIRKGGFAAPLTQVGAAFSEYQVESNTVYFYQATAPTVVTSTTMNQITFAGLPWGTGRIYAAATGGAGAVATQSISESGTDARVSGLGNISLVSASMVVSPISNTFPVLTKLTLLVPEPGTLTMFACGMGLLVLLGIRRYRSAP
jgi:hypothetical protein